MYKGDDLSDEELRLRQERERQQRIKRRASLGRPPPNFNLMMAEASRNSRPKSKEEKSEYQDLRHDNSTEQREHPTLTNRQQDTEILANGNQDYTRKEVYLLQKVITIDSNIVLLLGHFSVNLCCAAITWTILKFFFMF